MDRIYPDPTIFIDDSEPDLNAENLNKITNGLSDLDQRVAVDLLSESLAVTESGKKALDATVGKVLNDKIATLNGKFAFELATKVRFGTNVSANVSNIDIYDSENTFYRIEFGGNSGKITFLRYNNGLTTIFTK